MKKIIVILGLTALLILTGCQGERDKAVIVLDWTINTNHTGLYVALENGYFSDLGLDVTIQAPPETGAAALVASGTADLAVSYQEEITHARAADMPLVAVATILQHNTSGFASRAEDGIVTPADFEGKVYGGWGSPMEEAMIQALMEKYDADYSKVQNISIGSMDFFAATESDIDFTWIFAGWDGIAAEQKGIDINYIDLGQEEPALDYYTPVLAASENAIANHSDRLQKLLKAIGQGYNFAVAKPDQAAEILLKYAPELDEALVKASQDFLADYYIADAPRWGVMKLDTWERYKNWLLDRDLLSKDINPGKAFTNSLLPN